MIRASVLLAAALLVATGRVPAQEKPVDELIAAYRKIGAKKHARRAKAVLAIARRAGDDSLAFLREQLAVEKNARVRATLVEGLSFTPRPAILDELRELIRDPKRPKSEREAALRGLHRFAFDWRTWIYELVRGGRHASLDAAAVRTLAAGRDDYALDCLHELFQWGDDKVKRNVIYAAGTHYPVKRCYATLLEPQLAPQAPHALRQAALDVLSRRRDPRFFRHVRRLTAKEADARRLAAWIGWAARFDTLPALKTMLGLLDPDSLPETTAFLQGVRRMKSKAVASWFLGSGRRFRSTVVRRAAAGVIARVKGDRATRALLELATDRDEDVARPAVAALAGRDGARVRQALTDLLRDDNLHVADAAIRALWRQTGGSDEARELLTEIARRSRAWELRLAAIEQLASRDAEKAGDVFVENLDHERAQIRWAAAKALTHVRTKATVDLLIDRMGRYEGRTLHELASALAHLTDTDWGPDQERWRRWWTKVRDGYVLPDRPRSERPKPKTPMTYARYYGVEIHSERILFLVDTSGSMNGKGDRSKIRRAKDELIKVIDAVDDRTRFSVIAFSDGLVPYSARLVAATREQAARARRWVDALLAKGGTNVYDALVRAFDMGDVDTVFLLSDGAPSAGRVVDPDEILRLIRKRNAFSRIRINTINIGGGGRNESFLRKLAGQNHGTYRKP